MKPMPEDISKDMPKEGASALNLVIEKDYDALSRAGAEFVVDVLRGKPDAARPGQLSNVVVATGRTPMGLYQALAEKRAEGAFDAGQLTVFQLDAYLGLAPDDPRSLYGWTKRSFLDPLGIEDQRVVRLPGDSPDPAGACRAYEAAVVSAGGFDLAVLGLGPNGHLGFNEPPSRPTDKTRVVTLTEASVESNARYWGGRERVPRGAMTAGMDLLLAAKKILLLVSGAHKHDVLHQTLYGPITPDVPASYLQTAKDVTVLVDRAAWSGRD